MLFIKSLTVFFATGFGAGLLVHRISNALKQRRIFSAPLNWTGTGFFGTLIAFLFIWFGFPTTGFGTLVLLIILTLISIRICDHAEKQLGTEDDQRIILDEIIGFFWAVLFIPLASMGPQYKILVLLTAFILFRIFDVLKFPIPQAQNLPGGLGIVADDVFAGMLANLILQIIVRIIP